MNTDKPSIKAGASNDAAIQIGGGAMAACTPQFREAMNLLGFTESEGSFVYNAKGRAIWVNPSTSLLSADVTEQIVTQAEAIGQRAKINAIRRELDLPFGEIVHREAGPLKHEG